MKKTIVLEILLICIFGVTGWYLFGVTKQAELNNSVREAIEDGNGPVFSDGAGINVMGQKIDSINKTAGSERIVAAFLLRYDGLDADLNFWNEVNQNLLEPDFVRLTAYCENKQCVEAIRKNPDRAHFTVLEYGEVVDMQAVLGADSGGEFWLRGNSARKINWRYGTSTPFDIAMSIGLSQ